MQRGLARQSVGGVPPLEGTVEGGGFPHERHRGYRLKVASQRWRIRAVQEQMIYWLERELN